MSEPTNLDTTNSSTTSDHLLYNYASAVVYLYVQTPICAIGLILNVLNVCVFSQPAFTAPAYIMMKFLSMADAITLGVRIPQGLIFLQLITEISTNLPIYVYIFNIYVDMPITNMTETISAWLTVLLAVERYVSMRHWHLAKRYFTIANSKRFIYAIIIVAIVFNSPHFALQTASLKTVNDTLELNNSWTPFYESNYYAVYTWVRAIVVQFVPLTFLCNTNLLLFCLVTKHNKRIEQRQKGFQADRMSCTQYNSIQREINSVYATNEPSRYRKHSSVVSETSAVKLKTETTSAWSIPSKMESVEPEHQGNYTKDEKTSATELELLQEDNSRRQPSVIFTATVNGNKISSERTQRRRGAQQKLTILLIVVILLFLIGQVPQSLSYARVFTTLGICSELDIDLCSAHQLYRLISVILAQLAFASTFFVYLSLNRNFRNTLKSYFRSGCCHPNRAA